MRWILIFELFHVISLRIFWIISYGICIFYLILIIDIKKKTYIS